MKHVSVGQRVRFKKCNPYGDDGGMILTVKRVYQLSGYKQIWCEIVEYQLPYNKVKASELEPA